MKFSKEFEEQIIDLYKNGNSATKIGKLLNKNSTSILRVLKRNGIELNPKTLPKNKRYKFTLEQIQFIINSYLSGNDTYQIAKSLNSYNTSIRRVLIKHNIPLISTGERLRFVKTNPFKLGEEKSDYFIGMLITDGCISNNAITLSLKESDVYLLEEFAKFLSFYVKVNKYYHKAHKHYEYYVKFKNNEVCDYLNSLAEFNNKSFDLYLKVPLNWNILRGIIDGDGSVKIYNNLLKVSIYTMSVNFKNQLVEFLTNNQFTPKITQSEKELWQIALYRQKELIRLEKFLYSDATVFLNRKRCDWLAFLAIRNEKSPKFRESASTTLSEICSPKW
jgi:hypothetical protein